MQVWLSLRANFRAGDVLCVMNAGAFYDYLFLEELLSSFLRPRNGSLVLLGDNAYLVDTPYDTTVEHPVRQDNVSRDLLYEREEAMVSWARDYPDVRLLIPPDPSRSLLIPPDPSDPFGSLRIPSDPFGSLRVSSATFCSLLLPCAGARHLPRAPLGQ